MIDGIEKPRRKHSAQGLLEFALVLPLLLMLIFGLIEAGRLLFIYSSVMISSREAARYGSAVGDAGGVYAPYKDCTGIREAAKRVGKFAGISDANISISYDHGPGSGSAFATCPLSTGQYIILGDRIIVQVRATYRPLLPLVGFSSFPITSTARRTIIKDVKIEGTPPSPVKPTVSFVLSSATYNESAGEVYVTLQLTAPTDKAVVVPFTISGTAIENFDYTISVNKVNFLPGDLLVDFPIKISDDPMDEDDETIIITMGTPQNAIKGVPDVHTITIVDNDDPPLVSFSQAEQSQTEDIDGMVVLTLSAPSSRVITVNFTTGGTATSGGEDYTLNVIPISIPPGETSSQLLLDINDDLLDEVDETIEITLGDVVNATKGSPDRHVYTIVDNDLPPMVEFTWSEQNATESSGEVFVEVTLSAPSSLEIIVPFSFSGTATNGSDYTLDSSPYVIFPGQVTASLEVIIKPDTDNFEEDETIVLALLTPTNASLGSQRTHTVYLGNEIVPPSVSFTTSTQNADETGGSVKVSVSLSHATNQDVTVPFILDGSASNGEDYIPSAGQFTIPAGGATADVEFTILDDMKDEFEETIRLYMGTPTNATKGSPSVHTITILDDDSEPEVYFMTAAQDVQESAGSVDIIVKVSQISEKSITIPFILGGTANEGVNEDYTVDTPSPLVIPANADSGSIRITLNDDGAYEGNETIKLILMTPTNATLGTPDSHTLTIRDNEPVCPFAASDPYPVINGTGSYFYWTLQSPDPLVEVNLTEVTLTWPEGSAANVTGVTFGGTIFSGNAPPPSLVVTVSDPSGRGAFSSRDLIFIFDVPPIIATGDTYIITASFEGCQPIMGTYIYP